MVNNPRAPLLRGVSQFEVDFVIPRVGADLPLGIDPFLLYKSRDPALSELHGALISAFNVGVDAVRRRDVREARHLFDFPEVPEIGLGYATKGRQGSGVGAYLSELILETLRESRPLLERGVKHIEEMQLVSVGIGPDRTSDIAANLLKPYLIEYTQRQCELWEIPMVSGVPVQHVFDPRQFSWEDGYHDLPVSPTDERPILFVPRRIVRTLPWINYDDFLRQEFSAYLRAKRVRGRLGRRSRQAALQITAPPKEQVVAVARNELERVERYVSGKEATADQARPSLDYLDPEQLCPEADRLRERLASVAPGRAEASDYQRVVLEILNYLFNPELIDGEMEVRTFDGTERRDIVFTNDSDATFWSYLRQSHDALFLMFETKNKENLDTPDLNQTNTYLGERIGRLAFVATRNPTTEAAQRKLFSIYNDSHPKKIILVLADEDFQQMLAMRCEGKDPMRYIQKLYRTFRTSVQ